MVHIIIALVTLFATSSTAQTLDSTNVSTQLHEHNCPSNHRCELLEPECFEVVALPGCNFTCSYGEPAVYNLSVLPEVHCNGDRNQLREAPCVFCYQTSKSDHVCSHSKTCNSRGLPNHRRYLSTCKAKSSTLCFGARQFSKHRLCGFTTGYSWTTSMLLSITLGGFGVDRFYLGHWREGIGKLFSFGGLGVWTLIDVVLIAIGYVTPADGSLYEYSSNLPLYEGAHMTRLSGT